jgi:hypothetical protein
LEEPWRLVLQGQSLFVFNFRFDLKNSNVNDSNLEKMPLERVPDVVLVSLFRFLFDEFHRQVAMFAEPLTK